MVSQITNPIDQLAEASDALDAAEKRYDAIAYDFRQKTTTGDAQYDEDLRKALEANLSPGLRAAETEVMGVANDVTATARDLLARGQNPRVVIDPADEIRAGASYERIKDRVKLLSFEALAGSVRAALDADDRAELLNLYETLPARLDTDASKLSPQDRELRSELRALRAEIFDRMRDRSLDDLAEDAHDVLDRAYELKKRAGAFQRANKPKRVYAFQRPDDVIIAS